MTPADIADARATGATDREIHDTVLITAAFCMYNRYVDGLATWQPEDDGSYAQRAHEKSVLQSFSRSGELQLSLVDGRRSGIEHRDLDAARGTRLDRANATDPP